MTNRIEITAINSEINLSHAKQMIILHEGQEFKYFDEGCTRYVFVDEDMSKVVKLEKIYLESHHNKLELEIYNNANQQDKSKMAKTTLINGLIEQEFVTPIKFGGIKLNEKQRWFAQRCRNEVGWNSEGELVCFDLDEYMKY